MPVHLVGAGPGDPELLTVKGARLLGRAEVVVHDRLVHPEVLALAPPGAELISAAKEPRRPTMTQAEINALLVERGRRGQRVVRLKGGDPFVFARGGEEALSVTIVTGHEEPGSGATVEWERLAAIGGTLVVLMGAGRAAEIARRLIAGGLADTTPAATVRWATYEHQHVERMTLTDLQTRPVTSPSVIVIGQVAARDLSWVPLS